MKKAFRKTYDFASVWNERYLIFLKEHFTRTKPKFFSVINSKQVNTKEGNMYAVTIAGDIENPAHETIAECVINGEKIYLWNDHCWGVAVNEDGIEINSLINPIVSYRRHGIEPVNISGEEFNTSQSIGNRKPQNQTLLLFKIGIDPVE